MTVAEHEGSLQSPFDAVIFDLDGVVTDTAALHAEAWQVVFDDVLSDPRAGPDTDRRPFDPVADYREHVDGRPREDGVRAFLAARGLVLPPGGPTDPADAWTVHGVASRKNEVFLTLLSRRGVHVRPEARALINRLQESGMPLGLVSASRNARTLLRAAGLDGAFAVIVDGTDIARRGLAGKPDPATFLEAALALGVRPARTAVVEDAVAGVTAARRGAFGLVVAIGPGAAREGLERAGADVVLDDLAELDLGASRADPWELAYDGYDPVHETHREALTALGNGYLVTRGAMPEHAADDHHYPGTYLAGVYNRLTSVVDGVERVDESIVNAPNWLPFDLAVEDGAWWSRGGLVEESQRRVLDLRRGLLTRSVRLRDPRGRALSVVQRRLVSMDRPHLAALETTITPDGWSGRVRVRSGIDCTVANTNAPEGPGLAHHHLGHPSVEGDAATMVVQVETNQSGVRIAMAVRTTVTGAVHRTALTRETTVDLDLEVEDATPAVVDKVVAVATSRDAAIASPRDGALGELERGAGSFDELLRRHETAWARLWEHFAVDVETDSPVQLALNLHVFHVLQTISPHTAQLDVGVPARGLHGEGYRGHVFWDELFVLPLYVMRDPSVARALLDYRWRRLDVARHAAAARGLEGALYPWQSGSDGREETPRTLFNPYSGRWIADHSSRQLHVGLAVAYNVWQYVQATGDLRWFAHRGAELVIEIARLFSSLATTRPGDDRLHIVGVMGPDEFHTGYPDRPGDGLRDNAYTNVMAAWVCQRAVDSLSLLPAHERAELVERVALHPDEPRRWSALGERLAVPFHDGIISQFEGYEDLVELDWDHYRQVYGSIERLDLILESEGDSANHYRISKQADVLMLVYLLGPTEVIDVLGRLGYAATGADLSRAVDYYLERSAHGSTLSRVVHTSVLTMLRHPGAWSEFREALDADLDDVQGGTTGHGIHLGAMAGSVDIVLRSFTGMRLEADALVFRPRPPGALHRVRFEVRYRTHRIEVVMDHHTLLLRAAPGGGEPTRVVVDGVSAHLGAGTSLAFPIRSGP